MTRLSAWSASTNTSGSFIVASSLGAVWGVFLRTHVLGYIASHAAAAKAGVTAASRPSTHLPRQGGRRLTRASDHRALPRPSRALAEVRPVRVGPIRRALDRGVFGF